MGNQHDSLSVQVVPFDEQFLAASLRWFRDPELCRLMQTEPFDADVQREWFDALRHRQDYCIWGIALDGLPVGAFGLKNIDPARGAEWFMYVGDERHRGLGIGDWVEVEIVKKARALGIVRLWGHALSDNEPVLRLHRRHGFTLSGPDEQGRVYVTKDL
jgi:RimJ/RimL family protein N-acetyltransferase